MKNVTFQVYEYPELSATAKEKAKEWYLEDTLRSDILAENIEGDMEDMFPNSQLEVQWSLASCQGDGVNLHGVLCAEDILTKMLLDKDSKRRLQHYITQIGNIVLPYNRRYTYCMCDRSYALTLRDEWEQELRNLGYRDIDTLLLSTFAFVTQKTVSDFCTKWEKLGYEYLYNVEESEMVDMCEANEYYFYADGTFYG